MAVLVIVVLAIVATLIVIGGPMAVALNSGRKARRDQRIHELFNNEGLEGLVRDGWKPVGGWHDACLGSQGTSYKKGRRRLDVSYDTWRLMEPQRGKLEIFR